MATAKEMAAALAARIEAGEDVTDHDVHLVTMSVLKELGLPGQG